MEVAGGGGGRELSAHAKKAAAAATLDSSKTEEKLSSLPSLLPRVDSRDRPSVEVIPLLTPPRP